MHIAKLTCVATLRKELFAVCEGCLCLSTNYRLCLESVVLQNKHPWKANGIEVHLHLTDLRHASHALAQEALTVCFANLITFKRNPKILSDIINNIVSPSVYSLTSLSIDNCIRFFTFFVDKIIAFRSRIQPGTCRPNSCSPFISQSLGFSQFQDQLA